MAKSFRRLLDAMPKERRKQVDVKKRELLVEVRLAEIRKAFELTQAQLAETLKINQAAISKMESQSDMYVSTLRRFIKAMGGSLRVVADFPDGQFVISQFEQENEEHDVGTQPLTDRQRSASAQDDSGAIR